MKKIIGAIFGFILGLFLGLMIFGTIIRLTFNLLFGWGDSGPIWGVFIETAMILVVTIITTFYATRWGMGAGPN